MKRLLCALSIIAVPIAANGDTLTLTNNSSLNGSVRYESGFFYIQADYASGTKHYSIPRDDVRTDEINNETFNQGKPPVGIKAYKMKHQDWVAVNSQVKGAKLETSTVHRVNRASRRGTTETMSYPGASITGESRTAAQPSDSSGRDTLTLTNNQKQIGTLKRMTSGTIIFRRNGQHSGTEFDRDNVKLVTVKTSG